MAKEKTIQTEKTTTIRKKEKSQQSKVKCYYKTPLVDCKKLTHTFELCIIEIFVSFDKIYSKLKTKLFVPMRHKNKESSVLVSIDEYPLRHKEKSLKTFPDNQPRRVISCGVSKNEEKKFLFASCV